MLDLREQIARVIDEAVPPITAAEARGRVPSRRRGWRMAVLAAVAAVIAAAIVVPLSLRAGRTDETVHVGGGSTTLATTTTAAPIAEGRVVGRLDISAIGVHWNVVEGSNAVIEKRGPIHDPATPLPGTSGNSVIAGYRTTHGAPFDRLNELQPGDIISFTRARKVVLYEVDGSFVVPAVSDSVFPQQILDRVRNRRNSLTLITHTPRYSAAQRLVVTAHRFFGPTATRAGDVCPNTVPHVVPIPAVIPANGVDVKGLMRLLPPLAQDRATITSSEALVLARAYGNPQVGTFPEVLLARYTDLGHGEGLANRLAWVVVQTYFRPIDVKVGGAFPGQPYHPVCANYHLIVLDALDGHLLRGYSAT